MCSDPNCCNSFILVDVPKVGRVAKKCPECQRELYDKRIVSMLGRFHNLHPRVKDASFKNINFSHKGITKDLKEKIADIREFFSDERYDKMYVYGNTGTAKTHCAISLLKEQIYAGTRAIFITANRLSVVFVGDAMREEDAIADMQAIRRAELLIIDDLDQQQKNNSGFFPQKLAALIDESPAKIAITSNLSPTELDPGYYGSRLLSRLKEKCMRIPMYGVDYRPFVGREKI